MMYCVNIINKPIINKKKQYPVEQIKHKPRMYPTNKQFFRSFFFINSLQCIP